MKSLKLALVHLDVRYRQPEVNRQALFKLIGQAAKQGARIILTPEMSVSGYSFDNRSAINPFAEDVNGPTLTEVRGMAVKHNVTICVGLALRDDKTGVIANSFTAVGPNGEMLCRYNKINSESRWACPGGAEQANTFDTPWGRVGLLICSDSYHGLIPRVTALRGTDLLLIAANWPPAGLDPSELWRARALENGYYLAACNRTGIDRTLDCRESVSCVFNPQGEILLSKKSSSSKIFYVDLPLDKDGRLDCRKRARRLDSRRPELYHDCYLNLRPIKDLTGFLNLPRPDHLNLKCIVPLENQHPVEALKEWILEGVISDSLYILPSFVYSDRALDEISMISRNESLGIITGTDIETGHQRYYFLNRGDLRLCVLPDDGSEHENHSSRFDFGPARLHLIRAAVLTHPEAAVAASKQGCDLLVAVEKRLSRHDRLLAGVRTIENLAVSVCAGNSAGIWLPPNGHERWGEKISKPGSNCSCKLDIERIRRKNFQDRIDFNVLLRQPMNKIKA